MPSQKFDYIKTKTLERQRESIGLRIHEMATHFRVKDPETVRYWELGYRRPPPKHRTNLITYLWNQLQLKNDYQSFRSIWNEVMVKTWLWDDLSDEELWQHCRTVSNVFVSPPPERRELVGRKSMQHQLQEQLFAGNNIVLTGLPGVGKSALALSVVHNRTVMDRFKDGILWVGLGTEADVFGELGLWGNALGCDLSKEPSSLRRAQLIQHVIGRGRFLFVIDDVWSQSDAEILLRCTGPNTCYLLTTRDDSIANGFSSQSEAFPLMELDGESAYRLLQELAPAICDAEPEKTYDLVNTVGGLPLAITLLGGYLADPQNSVFAELSRSAVEKMFDPAERMALQKNRTGSDAVARTSLQETIALSLTGLSKKEVDAFYALGAFAPKPEKFELAAALSVSNVDASALARLSTRYLVEVDEDEQLSLHQMIADTARLETPRSAIERHQQYYLDYFRRCNGDWRRIETVYEQVKWAWQLIDQNEIVLEFIDMFKSYQEHRGLWRDIEIWTEKGVAVANSENWQNKKGMLLNLYGQSLRQQGKWKEAFEVMDQSLLLHRAISDRAGEAIALTSLGRLYALTSQWSMALEYLNQALDICEENGDLSTECDARNALGAIYRTRRRIDDAIEMYKRIIAIGQEMNDRLLECNGLLELGYTYRLTKQFDEGFLAISVGIAIGREIGNRRVEGWGLQYKGVLLKQEGWFLQATHVAKEALQIFRTIGDIYGEGCALHAIGDLTMWLGQETKAIKIHHQAIAIKQALGARHGVGQIYLALGVAHVRLNLKAEAIEWWQKALKEIEPGLPEYAEVEERIARVELAM